MSESDSPLARFVVFMFCLSIAGIVVAGAHYYAIDLPEQKALQAPHNSITNSLANKCPTCVNNCDFLPDAEKYSCLIQCELICL